MKIRALVGLSGILLVGMFAITHRTVARVDSWPSASAGPADSIGSGMAALLGAPPALLAGCGAKHVLIGYVDAPGDLRPEWGKKSDGARVWIESPAQQRRHTVGAVIASVYFSVAASQAADTVTVELVRRAHMPRGAGPDRRQYTFVPNPDQRGPTAPVLVSAAQHQCDRTI
jgi:hypothetical protein